MHHLSHLPWASSVSNGGASTGLSIPSAAPVRPEAVLSVPAPPTTVFLWEPWCQIPNAFLFVLVLPQKEQVFGMLAYFRPHQFPEGGTVAGPMFTDDSDLLSTFNHVTTN